MAEGTRARDIAPTGIRIPLDLRDALQREAHINGRTLSGEILARLRASLAAEPSPAAVSANELTLRDSDHPTVYAPPAMGDMQRMLLALFNAWPPDKQLALITVLRR